MAHEEDTLKRIEERASDMAGLLRGLEATAQIVTTLGTRHDAPAIDTTDVVHMMSSFREQLSTIRDSVQGIADTAAEALVSKENRVARVR